MRFLGAMMLVGVAAMMVAGCSDSRTEVPPLESTDVSAAGTDKSGPVIVEPGTRHGGHHRQAETDPHAAGPGAQDVHRPEG